MAHLRQPISGRCSNSQFLSIQCMRFQLFFAVSKAHLTNIGVSGILIMTVLSVDNTYQCIRSVTNLG